MYFLKMESGEWWVLSMLDRFPPIGHCVFLTFFGLNTVFSNFNVMRETGSYYCSTWKIVYNVLFVYYNKGNCYYIKCTWFWRNQYIILIKRVLLNNLKFKREDTFIGIKRVSCPDVDWQPVIMKVVKHVQGR